MTKNHHEDNKATKIIEKYNQEFSFIHASDIHLGYNQYHNDNRANDYIRAFEEILRLAIYHKVDFIILGGDVFTSLEILPEKLTKIVRILMSFINTTKKNIPIIAIEGNHDIRKYSRGRKVKSGQSWLKFMAKLGLIILLEANVEDTPEKIFTSYDFKLKKGGKIQIKSAMIYGTSYSGENPRDKISKIGGAIERNDKFFNILIQHFGIEGQIENIPGLNIQHLKALKDRVDYLALGHFHLQYILDDWIYNPGSSEATSSFDFSYRRGIFLVKVSYENKFLKKVIPIQLRNRKYVWKHIFFKNEFKNKLELIEYIIQRLILVEKDLKTNLNSSDPNKPFLLLLLKGKKPLNSQKIDEKELCTKIQEKMSVIGIKIYQKFEEKLITIDKFL